jgi:hypothetical protein
MIECNGVIPPPLTRTLSAAGAIVEPSSSPMTIPMIALMSEPLS